MNNAPSKFRPMLELRRIYRDFGSLRAVDDVSFQVNQGEVFGYIGPNDPDRVRRRLGFMPDYFGTYHNMSCYEYLDFFARSFGMRGRERIDGLNRVMGFTGLDAMAHKPVRGLSKGMKQRLCLGRALVHDPAVLILDEPAAGLDPRARIELRDMIRALAADGKSVLVSSHILTELAEICDRVAIIERGALLAIGTVDEIRQRRNVADKTELEFEVRIRIAGGAGGLADWLHQREDTLRVEVDGELLHFTHRATREAEVLLLKEIVQADFPIAEFSRKEVSLEDVFLQVTKGQIQ